MATKKPTPKKAAAPKKAKGARKVRNPDVLLAEAYGGSGVHLSKQEVVLLLDRSPDIFERAAEAMTPAEQGLPVSTKDSPWKPKALGQIGSFPDAAPVPGRPPRVRVEGSVEGTEILFRDPHSNYLFWTSNEPGDHQVNPRYFETSDAPEAA